MTYKRMEHHAAVYAHMYYVALPYQPGTLKGRAQTYQYHREREREKYAHMFNIDDVHIYNS